MSKHHWKMLMAFIAALLFAGAAQAEDKGSFAVVELGGAGEWGLNGDGSRFGPVAAVEFTPIKNWLVIETGITTLFSRGQTEWDTDLIFKKPFDLSPTVEFEPGIGPVWMHTVGGIGRTDSIGAEAVLEAVRDARQRDRPRHQGKGGLGRDRPLGRERHDQQDDCDT